MPSELYCTVPSEASLFKTKDAEASYRSAYEASLRLWPAGCEPIEIPTKFGLTHVLACGTPSGEPVLLLPAMAFSATMWYATGARHRSGSQAARRSSQYSSKRPFR